MTQSNERTTLSMHADRLGMVASILCFIHCILTPIAVSLLAVGVHYIPSEEKVHRVLAIFVAVLGAVAILFGYRRHRRRRVLLLISGGVLLIFATAYFGDRLPSHLVEVAITMMGSS